MAGVLIGRGEDRVTHRPPSPLACCQEPPRSHLWDVFEIHLTGFQRGLEDDRLGVLVLAPPLGSPPTPMSPIPQQRTLAGPDTATKRPGLPEAIPVHEALALMSLLPRLPVKLAVILCHPVNYPKSSS